MPAEEFSAKHYQAMDGEKFKAEAERLSVDLYGLDRTAQINAVYNAELRHRQEEAEAKEAAAAQKSAQATKVNSESGEPEPKSNFDSMSVSELRQYADDNDIDLGDATRKADIIEAIQIAEL